ncbi:MAG: hypothetical protein IJD40_15850 [Lachnospiraceae bacterium]|nr:hypothetical protein [Lachnospiraceae bacterium]
MGSNSYTSDLISQIKGNTSKDAKVTDSTTKKTDDASVVYEPSGETTTTSSTKSNKVDADTIAKLKADADAKFSQLRGIVEQLISKQSKASETVSIWEQFKNGVLNGTIEVDPATAKQAQEDISEDGYWGVKQTSERILDFAKAISGNDPEKAEQMREAIKKGYESAADLWGGELPELSQKTYDAVMKGLDDWKEEAEKAAATTNIQA